MDCLILLTLYVVVGTYLTPTQIAVFTFVLVNVLFVVAHIVCYGSN